MTTPDAAPHCGLVAVLGAPNAGKSTLVNAIVGVDGRRVYLLAGTVPLTTLRAALADLRANRPPRTNQ